MNKALHNKTAAPLSYRVASRLTSLCPQWLLYRAAQAGGFMHYHLSTEKRRAYLENIAKIPARERDFKPWSAFQNHALNILEMLKAPNQDAGDILNRLTIHGRENLDGAMGKRKGLIIVTIHSGNWELSGLGLALLGYPITTIAGEQLNDNWSESIKEWKRRYGIRVLSPESSMRDLYRDLSAGRIIVLHMDGDQFSNGIPVTFLGKPARMPRGPAHLSRVTGAALCYTFCVRRNRNHLDIHVRNVVAPPQSEQAEIDITKKLIAEIEECILAEPGQWCIFRRM